MRELAQAFAQWSLALREFEHTAGKLPYGCKLVGLRSLLPNAVDDGIGIRSTIKTYADANDYMDEQVHNRREAPSTKHNDATDWGLR